MAIIAIPSSGNGGLNETLNVRFGRSESITIISIEKNEITSVKTIPIYASEAIGNLGIHVANIIKENNASDVILKYIGVKAFQQLSSQNINLLEITDENLTVRECIDLFIQNKLQRLTKSNAHLIDET